MTSKATEKLQGRRRSSDAVRKSARRIRSLILNMGKSKNPPPPKVEIPPRGIGPVRFPNKNDVLCGRGGRINSHEGNVQFREIVNSLKHTYLSKSTRKLEKAHIAAQIVTQIRNMNPPGRFLKEDSGDGMWYDIGDFKARKKAGQALREDAPDIRHELGEDEDNESEEEDVKPAASVPASEDSKAQSPAVPDSDRPASPQAIVRASPIVPPSMTIAEIEVQNPTSQYAHNLGASIQQYNRQRYNQLASGRGHPQRYPQHMGNPYQHYQHQHPIPPHAPPIGESGPVYHEYSSQIPVAANAVGPSFMNQQQSICPYGAPPFRGPPQQQQHPFVPDPHRDPVGRIPEPQQLPPVSMTSLEDQQLQKQQGGFYNNRPTQFIQGVSDSAKSLTKQAIKAFSPLLPQKTPMNEDQQLDQKQPSKQVAFGKTFIPTGKVNTSGTSSSTGKSSMSSISIDINEARTPQSCLSPEQRRIQNISHRAQWQQKHMQERQKQYLNEPLSPPGQPGPLQPDLRHSVSMGTGESRYQNQLKISDKSSKSGGYRSSSSTNKSGISDLTMSLSLRDVSLGGFTRSHSFPGLHSSDLASLSDSSIQAIFDDQMLAPFEPYGTGEGQNSKNSSGTSTSMPSSTSQNRERSKSSSSMSRISDLDRPVRSRAQSNMSAAAMSFMSAVTIDSRRSSGSHRSSDSSWLQPYRTMQSISSDQNPWNDESSRSLMSDISTDLLALDLADPPSARQSPATS